MISTLELVTGNVIRNFLESKGILNQCPSCGQNEMSVAVDGDDTPAPALRVVHLMDDGSRRGFGQFMRVCLNCGHIHYIRDAEVLAFMEEALDNG